MEDYLPFLIFGGVFLVIGVIIYFSWLYEKKRTEALQALADEMGFAFSKGCDSTTIGGFGSFQLFDMGRGKTFANHLHGQSSDLDMHIFDYSYTTGSGKNKTTTNQTVLCFTLPDQALPTFYLRPEHFFDSVSGWFGYHDIDFDTHPLFSKKYMLKGQDEAAIRQIFDHEVLEHFEAGLKDPLSAEASGSRIMIYRSGKRIGADQVRPLMEEGFRLLGLLRARAKQIPSGV
jgi:hypothetical protein